ncbi:MAG: sporulation protein YqfC [Defluviitaleaceae bacterium]|nr:sporulation protein YqfC [Defluviitaleaceae bacterium]
MKREQGKHNTNIRSQIANLFELPREIVLNLPLISVIGNEELIIENYKSVVEYSEEVVRISTSCGILKVEGRKLNLRRMTSEAVTITGTLTNFGFII